MNATKLIGRTPGVCDGSPIILGTRISVVNIIEHSFAGVREGEILEYYPQLTLEQIQAALAYYKKHRVEIDTLLQEEDYEV